jgi:hypothetical protein
MKNTIDLKRATLILRALHIAVKNASRVRFEFEGMNAVTKIPNFAPPPDNADFDDTREIDLPYNAWVPPKSERQIMEENARIQKLEDWKAQQAKIRADLERARIKPAPETAPAAASPEPSRRASAGREATAPAAEGTTTTKSVTNPNTVPPHNFKPSQPTPTRQTPETRSTVTARKPPQAAATPPKQRKSAAHEGRHG